MLEVIKKQRDVNNLTLYRIVLLRVMSKCSKQFQLPKHRFKYRQNAPFCFLAFKTFSAVPTLIKGQCFR